MIFQENIPLAPLTTFKIGGPARYFVEVGSEGDLREAISWAKERNLPFVIFSGGSNMLVSDDGFGGLVIRMHNAVCSMHDSRLTVAAGCTLLTAIKTMSERGFGGWERMAGIPGSVGGAVRGNAGAFGSEIKDFVVSVRAIHRDTLAVRELSNTECDFGYRHSFFKDNPEWIIIDAEIELRPVDPREGAHLIEKTLAEREKRHLQDVRAAGSYFMNPVAPAHVVEMFENEKGIQAREGRVPAGWLIEKAGMKGARVGGAEASMQHPNYIVSDGTATATDVRKLASKIRESVRSRFSIELAEEAAQW